MDNVNLSGPLLVLLAATLAMAFGIWRGRPDPGGRVFVLVGLSSTAPTLLSS
ncbi:hypothetical protein [Deinococcus terrestris]|uniref:hypothetical protein n=1 Tax=Deinococcus terrestris TaxID=2651870 RepID=UPI0018847AA6|nr:hypothetical protein [Deinococcus terrestris]